MQRCHTYKIAVSKYQGRCEQSSEVFVKIIFFFFFFLGGGGGGGVRVDGGSGQGGGSREGSDWGGVRVDVNEEFKFLGKFKKKKLGGGRSGWGVRVDGGSGRGGGGGGGGVGGGGGGGVEGRVGLGGVRVDVNEELKFL